MNINKMISATVIIPVDEPVNELQLISKIAGLTKYATASKGMILPSIVMLFLPSGPSKALLIDAKGFKSNESIFVAAIMEMAHELSIELKSSAVIDVNGTSLFIDPDQLSDTIYCKYPQWLSKYTVKLTEEEVSVLGGDIFPGQQEASYIG